MNTPTNRAVIYCRVSTKEQVEEGNSLATQERLCREYALQHGFEVVNAFIEQGESAKTANRTELQNLLQYCTDRKNQISTVIAYKIDRISRNTDDYSQIRIILKQVGIQIKSTSENFETLTPAGKFMENMIANMAQFDNDVRTERCVNGMKEGAREGRYVWMAPVGYANVRINGKGTIEPSPMAPLVTKAFEMVAQNASSAEDVRKKIMKMGLLSREGKSISKAQFFRMLKNPVYTGSFVRFKEKYRGTYQPLISEDIFNITQKVLAYKKRRGLTYAREREDFPLRRFISHPDGTKLTGGWSKGKTKRYAYYRFQAHKLNLPKAVMEENFKRLLDSYHLDDKYYEQLKKLVQLNVLKKFKDQLEAKKEVERRIAELRNMESNLIEKNYKGVLSNELMERQLMRINKEIEDSVLLIIDIPQLGELQEDVLDIVDVFLKKPSEIWNKTPFPLNLELQKFYFPKGITFDGSESKTPEICSFFKAKKVFFGPLSHKADSTSPALNTPEIDNNLVKQDLNNSPDYTISDKSEEMELLRAVWIDAITLKAFKHQMDQVAQGKPIQSKPASDRWSRYSSPRLS